jgi:hypothetical protein
MLKANKPRCRVFQPHKYAPGVSFQPSLRLWQARYKAQQAGAFTASPPDEQHAPGVSAGDLVGIANNKQMCP